MRRMPAAGTNGNGGPARVQMHCSPVLFSAVPASWLHVAIDRKTGTGTRRLGESP